MNCRRVEQLIALHAGGDLAPDDARAVAEHVNGCPGCRSLLADFTRSRELLRAYEPPEFDAAFFDSVRGNVMREIARARQLSSFAPFLPRLLGRRPLAYAASLALLIVIGALFFRTPKEHNNGPGNQQRPVETADVANAGRNTISPHVIPPEMAPAPITAGRKPPRPVTAKAPRRSNTAPPPLSTLAAQEAAPLTSPGPTILPPQVARESAPSPEDISLNTAGRVASLEGERSDETERKVLRIELQTGDPNVRIIWLSPQAAEGHTRD